MIVRILTEAQYELDGDAAAEVEKLDAEVVDTCQAGDEARFHENFARLLELVRSRGKVVEDDDLRTSELILPPPDTSLEEARREFTAEGLIPE
jgi:hypothetical protein